MAAGGLVLLWLCLVYLAGLRYAGGSRMEPAAFFGLLLGCWPVATERGPALNEVFLVALGRLGAMLLLAIVLRAALAGPWFPAVLALALASAGLAGLSLLGRERPSLEGLGSARVLLRLPDGYQLFQGRVKAGGPLCGASLAGLDLRKHGLLVLAIGRHRTRDFIEFPKGQEVLGPGDLLIVYGCPEGAEGVRT